MRRVLTPEQDDALRRVYTRHQRGEMVKLAREWGIPASTLSTYARQTLGLSPIICYGHPFTSAMDVELKYAYQHGRRGDIKRLAARWGIPATTCSWRALNVLGQRPFSRSVKHTWTDLERDLLESYNHLSDDGVRRLIQRRTGTRRTLKSIACQRTVLGLSRKPDGGDCYSPELIASGLGCNPKTVYRWIQRGLLRANSTDKYWRIKPGHLRAFLIGHVVNWDAAKVDKWFLVDVLTGKTSPKHSNDGAP